MKQELPSWGIGAILGITIISLIIIARLIGLLENWEWNALDYLLRLRPSESTDERITIIGIDEEDIHRIGHYPIPDGEIASLLKKLQQYQPRVIALDIVRDLPVEPGHEELAAIFKTSQNLLGIEKIIPESIKAPPDLPLEQIGFADTILDRDGNIRRSLLGMGRPETPQQYEFSLALRLAQIYLEAEGIILENGVRDPHAMRFGEIELPRFTSHAGGYVREDDFGVQVLLNFRHAKEAFRVIGLNDIKSGNLNPQWIQDRIVIIGITAPSIKDTVDTNALKYVDFPGKIYGLAFHAHTTSQILSAVLDQRPLLKVWSPVWEYLWVILWGILGICLAYLTCSPGKSILAIIAASFTLIGVSYLLLIWGWWVPVAPAITVLVTNSMGLIAFYQYDQALRAQIQIRQHTIEHTFSVIHNGPLQSLAYLLRKLQDKEISQEEIVRQLQNLNLEIREIGEYLKQETLSKTETLRLGSRQQLDLNLPLHELLYEVFSSTLERKDLPCLQNLKVKIRDFQPLEPSYLTKQQKRALCQFLEEALCNVGKHAVNVTRLSSVGKQQQGYYTLSIKDNGAGINSTQEHRGTKQCREIAKLLGGEFKRESLEPKGTLCELTWRLKSRKLT